MGLAVLALCIAAPALAQEDIDAGKTPAQLYAQDCAICHKTPHGLSQAGGIFGLQSFLREHYTASKESAAAIAAYLASIDRGPPPHEQRARPAKRAPKNEKAKAREDKSKKPGEAKSDTKPDTKPDTKGKPEEAKQSTPPEAKPDAKPDTKPESKPADAKPESKPSEAKSEAKSAPKHKPVEAKSDAKTNGSKPDAKPEKKPD